MLAFYLESKHILYMDKLNGFKKYIKEPNTVSSLGTLYTKDIKLSSLTYEKKRTIRVYLPSTYDFNNPKKRFKTLYMMDGKNLFDDYTSFVGEWKIDEEIENRISSNKEGLIVVGIDAPVDGEKRALEMAFKGKLIDKEYQNDLKVDGVELGKVIINVIKPLIDKTFFTLPSKEDTGIGGSSMGGLFSFYMWLKYREYFGYVLSYSPGFLIYDYTFFKKEINRKLKNVDEVGKIYFYVGGKGYEEDFIKSTIFTFLHLKKLGLDEEKMKLVLDSTLDHNEASWNKYLEDGLSFLLD